MKDLQTTPHLDPLPSSDEGRGNPAVSVKRTHVVRLRTHWRSERFPLPFGRGEDQGEGLLWKTFVSLTKWKWGWGEGKQSVVASPYSRLVKCAAQCIFASRIEGG